MKATPQLLDIRRYAQCSAAPAIEPEEAAMLRVKRKPEYRPYSLGAAVAEALCTYLLAALMTCLCAYLLEGVVQGVGRFAGATSEVRRATPKAAVEHVASGCAPLTSVQITTFKPRNGS